MKLAMKNKWLFLTLLIWAIIFCVPAQRVLLKAMAKGSPWIPFTVLPHDWNSRFGLDAPELPLQINAIKGGAMAIDWPDKMETLDQLDARIQRHPDLPWLIALRLQVTSTIFKKNRLGGELSDGLFEEHLKAGIPSRETTGEKVNFTPAQMQRTLKLCRQGEKLEPQNAFFSWMRACFLLIDWQDQKAWQVLDKAAHKTYWNNHYSDFTNSYVDAAATALNRPLLSIEKLNFEALNVNFPMRAQTREMCRIINWEGIKRKRAGKNEQALQIWSNLHHVMFLAAQGDPVMIDFLVDYGMMNIAQSGATYPGRAALKNKKEESDKPPPLPDENQQKKEWQTRVRGFVSYAQKYHRSVLARQIQQEAQQSYQLFQQTRKYTDRNIYMDSPVVETQFRQLGISGALFVLGVMLILILAGSIFLWLFALCYDYLRTRKSTFTDATFSPPAESIKGTKLCRWAELFLCLAIVIYLLGSVSTTTMDTTAGIANFWQMLPVTFHFSFHNIFDKFLAFTGYLGSESSPVQFWRILILLVPIIVSGIYLLQKRIRRQTHHRGRNLLESWICVLSLLILTSLIPQVYLNRSTEKWAERNIHGEMWEIHQVKNMPAAKH